MEQNEKIIVKVPKYLQEVDELIFQTNPRLKLLEFENDQVIILSLLLYRVLANYLIWRMVFTMLAHGNEKMRNILDSYLKVLSGRRSRGAVWENCMSRLYSGFGASLSALYIQSHFDETSKDEAFKMVGYIKDQFLKTLQGVEWMDKKTKKKAIIKANSINTLIGYAPEILNPQKMEKLYTQVNY